MNVALILLPTAVNGSQYGFLQCFNSACRLINIVYSTVAIGTEYLLYLDQWGISGATGSQCSHVVSYSGTTVAWATTWTWSTGSGGVKTFSNIAAITGLNQKLSAIKTIPVSLARCYL